MLYKKHGRRRSGENIAIEIASGSRGANMVRVTLVDIR